MDNYLQSPLERLLFENHPLPLWIYDLKTLAFLAVNEAAVEKYGYSREEFRQMTITDIRPSEDVPRLLEFVAQNRQRLQNSGLWRHRLKDGTIIDVRIISHTLNLGGQEAVLVVAQDMTEHRRVEKEAQLSEHRLMALVKAAMDAVVTIDGQHRIVLFNPAAEKMFGYRETEILGQPLNVLLPEDQQAGHTKFIEQFGSSGATSRSMDRLGEVKGKRKSGEEFPLEASISHVDVGGEKLFTAVLRDVSERRRAEMIILESEEKYRTLVENASDGIAIIQKGRVMYANRRLAEMSGMEVSEIVGQRFDKFIHPSEIDRVLERYRRRRAGETVPILYETALRRKGNVAASAEITTGLISYQGAPAEIAIVRDVSERKAAEQAMQRRLKDMMALNAVATAGAKARNVDDLIESVTQILGIELYPDNCGVLVADEARRTWRPHPSYRGIGAEKLAEVHSYSEGIAGKVISTGKTVSVGDVRQEPAYQEATPGIQSELCIPIVVNEKIFGCLNAESNAPDVFTDHDERFMSTVADTLATAIGKIQLLQTEKRRREDAEILYNTTRDLVIERDLATLLRMIVERAAGMVGAVSGSLYLCEPEERQVRCVVDHNTPHDHRGTVLQYGEGAAGMVAETGEPLIIEDYRIWKGRAAAFEQDQSFVSVLSIPMYWQDRLIGVLQILENTQARSFTVEDVRIVRHFANQAAIAVENARLFEMEQHRRQEAEILRETTLSLTYAMESERLYEIILDALQKLIPYDSASIELADQGYLQIVAGRGLPHPERIIGTRYQNSEEKWGELQRLRGPIIISDVREDDRFVKFEETNYIRSWMGIPLFARDKLIGFLNLDSRTVGFYTVAHAAIGQTFGSQAAIAIDNARLLNDLQTSNFELMDAYDTTLEGWAKALELRDKETEGHSRRVKDITLYLAQQFGISGSALTHIRRGVILHDIGKMGVPDQILKKTGPLLPEEWDEMRRHPQYAYDLLSPISFLRPALDIPYCHHERWDGSGYPRGLKGDQIPLAARIFAVVDVWDALSHDRPYRKAWPKEQIISYITEQSQAMFDPRVVYEFLKMLATRGELD